MKFLIHSYTELMDLVQDTARKFSVDKFTVSTGHHHTLIYNYNAFEFNFMVTHDMTVVSPKGNVCELQPKVQTVFTIYSVDPHDKDMDGIEVHAASNDVANLSYILPNILNSKEYKTDGTIVPCWLHEPTNKTVSVTDVDTIELYCKLAFAHVKSEWEECREITRKYKEMEDSDAASDKNR